jgi:soluble lytic murein transglycosylase-like protein
VEIMNLITQSNQFFPNKYEVVSTTRGPLCTYLHEIIMKIFLSGRGMLFDKLCFRSYRKELENKVLLKKGLSLFARKIDLQQAFKYGAGVYAVAAMLFIPAGICSRQNGPAQYYPWSLAQTAPSPPVPAIGRSTEINASDSEKAAPQDDGAADAGVAEPDLPFEAHIMQAAQTYQVDPVLIRAIIMAESNYNPKAVSHRGAQGLMQLMPTTAKWLGIQDSFDPALNIDGGVRYFKKLLDRFDGNVKLALAAYNAGSRYVRKYGGVPPFKATRIYIKKVLRYHRLLQEQLAADGDGLTTS